MSCVLIIPVLRHDLIGLLAFLNKQVLIEGEQLCVHTVQNSTLCVCACALHPGGKKKNNCFLIKTGKLFTLWTRITWSPPSHQPLFLFIYWEQKRHVWSYRFNLHPVWPRLTTSPGNWLKKHFWLSSRKLTVLVWSLVCEQCLMSCVTNKMN